MTVPSDKEYDLAVHLSVQDVAVDIANTQSLLRVTIKQSKTDPFRKGVDLYVGKTSSSICLSAQLPNGKRNYTRPLFVYQDRRKVTHQRFSEAVRAALAIAGIDRTKYCTHSFCIGAATTVAAKGIDDAVIKC